MGIFRCLSGLAVRQLVDGAARATGSMAVEVGVQAVTGFLSRHFTSQADRLLQALERANDRAWRTLEIALAGDSLWDRCKSLLSPAEERAFRGQIQAFLNSCPDADWLRLDARQRQQCLRELRSADKAGLLRQGSLSAEDLAGQVGAFAGQGDAGRVLAAERAALEQIAEEIHQAGYPSLARLLQLAPARQESLLALAVRYYFRRAVEDDEHLYRGLAWASWESLAEGQRQGLEQMTEALGRHGRVLEQALDQLHEVLLETRDVVRDIQAEMREQKQQIQEMGENVVRLLAQLQQQAGTRRDDSLSTLEEEERQVVRALLARYRSLPAEQQKRLPALVEGLGALEAAADEGVLMLPGTAGGPSGPRSILAGFDTRRHPCRRLALRLGSGPGLRNIGLLAQDEVSLGRDRGNDIVLRVLPRSEANDALSRRISGKHALARLTAEGPVWHDLGSRLGTVVDGKHIKEGTSCLLLQGSTLRPANVLSLHCDRYGGIHPLSVEAYRAITPAGSAEGLGPTLPVLRLTRYDMLLCREEYVLFRQRVLLGSDAACPVAAPHPSVGPVHAQVLDLGGAFWLEPLDGSRRTLVDGQTVPPGRLVPLAPGMKLCLGEVELRVTTYQQYSLDWS